MNEFGIRVVITGVLLMLLGLGYLVGVSSNDYRARVWNDCDEFCTHFHPANPLKASFPVGFYFDFNSSQVYCRCFDGSYGWLP